MRARRKKEEKLKMKSELKSGLRTDGSIEPVEGVEVGEEVDADQAGEQPAQNSTPNPTNPA